MRLLNTSTIRLEDTGFDDPEGYAILSHAWGEGEVSFQEIQADPPPPALSRKLGYIKIKNACAQAASDGFKYVWIDTCCIDKTSSAELSEALNSMYQWYRNAEVCYAYLADVPGNDDPHSAAQTSAFVKSRWFKRGWTLQELVAPQAVVFYGKDWTEIGTKSSLREAIMGITGISGSVLLMNHPGLVSVAQRMSWAANRQTTREEDIAYCLMGIFGINMPILYGEGKNAFYRLQQAILMSSDDHTIFAWRAHGSSTGLLAKSPADFAQCSQVRRFDYHGASPPYSLTNKGVCIRLPLIPQTTSDQAGLVKAVLNAEYSGQNQPLCIYLKKNPDNEEEWMRENNTELVPIDKKLAITTKATTIYVKEPDTSLFDISQWLSRKSTYTFIIQVLPSHEHSYHLEAVHPAKLARGDLTEGVHVVINGSGTSGALLFRNKQKEDSFIVMLGIHNYNTWSDVVCQREMRPNETLDDVWKSYYVDGGRGAMLWNNLDRTTKHLGVGQKPASRDLAHVDKSTEKEVSVAIRRAAAANSYEMKYMVHINIKASTVFRPSARYNFLITVVGTHKHELRVSDSYPTEFWEQFQGQQVLVMKGSGTSGCLMFQHQATRKNVAAVMIGVHNYRMWCDIVTDFGSEPVQSIRDSYYRSQGRGAKLWENLTETSKEITTGRRMHVSTMKTCSGEKEVFKTTITIQ